MATTITIHLRDQGLAGLLQEFLLEHGFEVWIAGSTETSQPESGVTDGAIDAFLADFEARLAGEETSSAQEAPENLPGVFVLTDTVVPVAENEKRVFLADLTGKLPKDLPRTDLVLRQPLLASELLGVLQGKGWATDNRSGRQKLVPPDLKSTLAQLSMVDLVQLFKNGSKSGVLQLVCPKSRRYGAIAFREGAIIEAVQNDLTGTEAAMELVRWSEGEFLVFFGDVLAEQRIAIPTESLLIESLRLEDEELAGLEKDSLNLDAAFGELFGASLQEEDAGAASPDEVITEAQPEPSAQPRRGLLSGAVLAALAIALLSAGAFGAYLYLQPGSAEPDPLAVQAIPTVPPAAPTQTPQPREAPAAAPAPTDMPTRTPTFTPRPTARPRNTQKPTPVPTATPVLLRLVKIATTPAGAAIMVNGNAVGEAPLSHEIDPTVPIEIAATLPGHREVRREFSAGSQLPDTLKIQLQQAFGNMRITSIPFAEIYIDGEDRGVTPLTLRDLPVQTYEIVLRPQGMDPHTERVTLKEGATVNVHRNFYEDP